MKSKTLFFLVTVLIISCQPGVFPVDSYAGVYQAVFKVSNSNGSSDGSGYINIKPKGANEIQIVVGPFAPTDFDFTTTVQKDGSFSFGPKEYKGFLGGTYTASSIGKLKDGKVTISITSETIGNGTTERQTITCSGVKQ